jgi:predicted alpha/beta-fold hydrolase
MRSCGGTEGLTRTLYHSGLTSDTRHLLDRFRAEGRGPCFIAGFSLGGNLVLKLAGELGEAGRELLAGAVAVSTPIDLHACVRRLDSHENRLYARNFVNSLKARYLRRHRAAPELFPLRGLNRVRSIYEFDDEITARAFPFGTAENYYRTQSALRFLPRIRVPTLMIQAQDDPMIPFELFERPELRDNPCIRLVATRHGGHVGYLARRGPRFWLDPVVRDWIEEVRNKALHTIV